jgi:hypothetical protein
MLFFRSADAVIHDMSVRQEPLDLDELPVGGAVHLQMLDFVDPGVMSPNTWSVLFSTIAGADTLPFSMLGQYGSA